MADTVELWAGGPVMLKEGGMAVSTDSVLLADFAAARTARTALDLGCGSGIISLLLLQRMPSLTITGVELDGAAAESARNNMAMNNLSGRASVVTGDFRDYTPAAPFDLAVSNPPYFTRNSGRISPDEIRAAARSEETCTLEELAAAAARCLKFGGRFDMVYRPERLSEAFCTLTAAGLEPKRLRLVHATPLSVPSMVLIECRRGGKPGLDILPPLILKSPDGDDSEEVKKIYHLGGN